MISNINISFLYWLYLYDVNFYLYSPFFKFWHYLLSLDRDFENTSKIDYLKIVKLHDRIFMLFSQFICSFSSFQPRAPKVCPEGAQIFSNFYHQFVSMKGIDTENFRPISFLLQFLEAFQILQNLQKFPVLCLGPFSWS